MENAMFDLKTNEKVNINNTINADDMLWTMLGLKSISDELSDYNENSGSTIYANSGNSWCSSQQSHCTSYQSHCQTMTSNCNSRASWCTPPGVEP